jgi:HlyD family secretion protein
MEPHTAESLAELDVKAKKEQLFKARHALKECTLLAPTRGTILRVLVGVGEALGANPKQPALLFCPSTERIIRAEVEQEFARRVVVGQSAVIEDDATGATRWKGKVKRVSDWYLPRRSILLEPMQFNDVRTLEVIIGVVDADPKNPLRIGQRVRVLLDGNTTR